MRSSKKVKFFFFLRGMGKYDRLISKFQPPQPSWTLISVSWSPHLSETTLPAVWILLATSWSPKLDSSPIQRAKLTVGLISLLLFKGITVLHFQLSREMTKNSGFIYSVQFSIYVLYSERVSPFSLTPHNKKQKSLLILWVY